MSKGLEEVMRRRLERKKERKNVRIRWTSMKSRQRKEDRKKAVHTDNFVSRQFGISRDTLQSL